MASLQFELCMATVCNTLELIAERWNSYLWIRWSILSLISDLYLLRRTVKPLLIMLSKSLERMLRHGSTPFYIESLIGREATTSSHGVCWFVGCMKPVTLIGGTQGSRCSWRLFPLRLSTFIWQKCTIKIKSRIFSDFGDLSFLKYNTGLVLTIKLHAFLYIITGVEISRNGRL